MIFLLFLFHYVLTMYKYSIYMCVCVSRHKKYYKYIICKSVQRVIKYFERVNTQNRHYIKRISSLCPKDCTAVIQNRYVNDN